MIKEIPQEDVSEEFSPRGIGNNWLKCFVCGEGGGDKVQSDMAAFVQDKESGQRVVAMFAGIESLAVLDFRPHEPDWVQVKVGACEQHLPQLESLYQLTRVDGRISLRVVKQALGIDTLPDSMV